jgi:hypothetical protein
MTTSTLPVATTPPPSDDTLINTLIMSHGSVALAAERLDLPTTDLVSRLPALPYDQLLAGIRVARLLKLFDSLTILQDVVVNTLEMLTPEGRARLLVQLSDRLDNAVGVAPPVQAADPNHSNNFQFNFGSPEAAEDARVELAQRIINIDGKFARAPEEPDPSTAD